MDKAELLERTFFGVEKVKSAASKYGWSVIRKDTGEAISDVSEDYVLIPNREAVMPFVEKYGIESLESVRMGKASFAYKFNIGEDIDMGGGDIVRRGGYVLNSYNKSTRFQWQDAWFRKVCSNGLFAFSGGVSVSEIHYGDFDYGRAVREAVACSGKKDVSTWRSLRETPLTREEKIGLIREFSIFKDPPQTMEDGRRNPQFTVNERVRNLAETNAAKKGYDLENPENGWGLLNNLNWGIARACGSGNVSRLIAYNRKAEEFCVAKVLS